MSQKIEKSKGGQIVRQFSKQKSMMPTSNKLFKFSQKKLATYGSAKSSADLKSLKIQ